MAKAAKTKPIPKKVAKKAAPPAASKPTASKGGAVHILSSKACQAFEKRATQVSAAIKAANPSASVTIDARPKEGKNPDKGSFVISVAGREVVALRGMPRPFTAMKALDMDAVAVQVLALL